MELLALRCVGRRQWQPTPVLLPGKSHGCRSLVSCSPWGCAESDMTEQLHFDFSLSCIGEGNGSPLQCSCLENPGNGEAWWAAVYGVAQSWTRLKRLSSSSSSSHVTFLYLEELMSFFIIKWQSLSFLNKDKEGLGAKSDHPKKMQWDKRYGHIRSK